MFEFMTVKQSLNISFHINICWTFNRNKCLQIRLFSRFTKTSLITDGVPIIALVSVLSRLCFLRFKFFSLFDYPGEFDSQMCPSTAPACPPCPSQQHHSFHAERGTATGTFDFSVCSSLDNSVITLAVLSKWDHWDQLDERINQLMH